MQCFSPVAKDLSSRNIDLEYKIQLGGKINRSPSTSEETTTSLGFEVEGEDGTRTGRSVRQEGERLEKVEGTHPVSSSRVWQSQSKTQEKTQLGPSQASWLDRGLSFALDSGSELGRAHGWQVGLGLDYRVDLSPVSLISLFFMDRALLFLAASRPRI